MEGMEMLDLVLFDSEAEMETLQEKFTEGSGDVLNEGDERDTVLKCMLYMEECLMNEINKRANDNLVAFCDETHLTYYGAQQDTYRLEAESAACTVRFTASELAPSAVTVPEGSRVTADGKIFFAVPEGFTMEPGGYADVECVATEPGAAGNGYLAGQIDTLANTVPYVERVINLEASGGGSDIEKLDDFREDVLYAPLKFNTTGSVGAYTYKTREVSASIADVYPRANGANITVYILCKNGELPSDELLAVALEYLLQERIRAVTDHITTDAAVRAHYQVAMTYKVADSDYATLSAIRESVESAVHAYISEAGSKMGTAINPEMLKKAAYSAGAASVEVESPAEYRKLEKWEVPYCESCAVEYGGLLGG